MKLRSASLRSPSGGGDKEPGERSETPRPETSAAATAVGVMEGVEDWASRRETEPATAHRQRIAAFLDMYERTAGDIMGLQEQIRAAASLAGGEKTPEGKREELMGEVGRMKSQLQGLLGKRALILRNAGPFKERMVNQQRFDSLRNSGGQGLTSPGDQEAVPRKEGGERLAAAMRDPPPAVQPRPPPPPIQAAVGQEAGQSGKTEARVRDPGGAAATAGEAEDAAGKGGQHGRLQAPAQDGADPPEEAAKVREPAAGSEEMCMDTGGGEAASAVKETVPRDLGLTAATDRRTEKDQGESGVVRGESGLPAGQGRRVSYASSSASSGDEGGSSSGGSGGRLVTEVRRMESPLHAGFVFSNDLPPEDVPGGKSKRRSRRKGKTQYMTKYVYGPLEATSVPCARQPALATHIPSSPATSSPGVSSSYLSAPTFTFTQSIPQIFRPPSSSSQVSPIPTSPSPPSHPSQSSTPPLVSPTPPFYPPQFSTPSPSTPPPTTPGEGVAQVSVRSKEVQKKGKSRENSGGAPIEGEGSGGSGVVGEGKNKGRRVKAGRNFYSDVDDVEEAEEGGRRVSLPSRPSRSLPRPHHVQVAPAGLATPGQGGAGGQQVEGSTGAQGAGTSASPLAPPVQKRTYARVVAGGSSVSRGSGSGDLQKQILEAMMGGRSEVTIEGEVIQIGAPRSRYRPQERGWGDFWSSPTGPAGKRRNVVRLQWCSHDQVPPRSQVVELLLDMGFRARDIYALIHPYNTRDFDVSFVRPEGLELFWLGYDQAQSRPGWSGFAVIPISCQSDIKTVTVLTRNESLSCVDISTWLKRYGDIQGLPKKDLDEYGIWSGAWTYSIKLRRSGPTLCHIPSSAFLGRDRILVFYRGQPKVCHRCGDPSHFSANCLKEVCVKCGGVGHSAQSCGVLRCHLCGDVGHPFSKCPLSYANADPFRETGGGEPERMSGGRGGGEPVNEIVTVEEVEESSSQGRERVSERANPSTSPVSEAPGEGELEVDARRLGREDGTGWQTQGPRKGRLPSEGGRKRSPLPDQVTEGTRVASLLTESSNRFLALDANPAIPGDGGGEGRGPGPSEEPAGEAVPSPLGPIVALGGGTEPEPLDKELHQGSEGLKEGMDTSVSLKRTKEGQSSVRESERKSKKRVKGGENG